MRIARFFVKTVSFLVVLVAVLSLSAAARAQLWDGLYLSSPYTSNISVGTTDVQLVSISATAPNTDCPCRAFVEYFVPVESPSSTSGHRGIETWVTDGTNTFAHSVIAVSNANASTSLGASGLSTVTYSNSQSVTFSLYIVALVSGWTADQYTLVTGSENYFRVLFLPSD